MKNNYYDIKLYQDESEYNHLFLLNSIKKEINYVEIYKSMIPKIINEVHPFTIYCAIFDINMLEEEIIILFNHPDFDPSLLTKNHINELVKSERTRTFLYQNIEQLTTTTSLLPIINALKEHKEFTKDITLKLIDNFPQAIWNQLPIDILDEFDLFFNTIEIKNHSKVQKYNIDEATILKRLSFFLKTSSPKKTIEIIQKLIVLLPQLDISTFLIKNKQITELNDFANNNIELLIKNSKGFAFELIEGTNNVEQLKKYSLLLKLRNLAKTKSNVFDYLISQNKEEELKYLITKYLDISKSKDFYFLNNGSTTFVYKVGDYCLKISINKYTNSCPRSFRIIKTIEQIKLLSGIEIEVQKYLKPKPISEQDIYELLLDLVGQNLEVTDPHILNFRPNNFGFIEDLSDCDIDDINKLPIHFIEKPLVIYDKDLIYFKGDLNKRRFNLYQTIDMDDVVKNYTSYIKRKTN